MTTFVSDNYYDQIHKTLPESVQHLACLFFLWQHELACYCHFWNQGSKLQIKPTAHFKTKSYFRIFICYLLNKERRVSLNTLPNLPFHKGRRGGACSNWARTLHGVLFYYAWSGPIMLSRHSVQISIREMSSHATCLGLLSHCGLIMTKQWNWYVQAVLPPPFSVNYIIWRCVM